MKTKNPWFNHARSVEEQLKGLDPAIMAARGKHVLDVGCAEGLIGRHFVDFGGAQSCDGIDNQLWLLEAARSNCVGRPMEFHFGNAEEIDKWWGSRKTYDIVLLLSIIHKVHSPRRLLRAVSGLAREMIAVRVPKRSFHLKRGTELFDMREIMPKEWKLADEQLGPRGEWVGIFRR